MFLFYIINRFRLWGLAADSHKAVRYFSAPSALLLFRRSMYRKCAGGFIAASFAVIWFYNCLLWAPQRDCCGFFYFVFNFGSNK